MSYINGRLGAYKLLLCYFGANIGYPAIRYDLKCRDAVVIEIRRRVYDVLDQVGVRAILDMSVSLEQRRLIKERACAEN